MSAFEQSVAQFLTGKATSEELRYALESMAPLESDYVEFVLTTLNNLVTSGHLDSKAHQDLLNTAIKATTQTGMLKTNDEVSADPDEEEIDDKTVVKPVSPPRTSTTDANKQGEQLSNSEASANTSEEDADDKTIVRPTPQLSTSKPISESETAAGLSSVNSESEQSISGVDSGSATNQSSAKLSKASAWPAGGFSDTASPAPTVGSVIKERFVVEEMIAAGGMGIVFKARDLIKEEAQERNQHVALKVLNDSFKQHPESYLALSREARKTQDLAHPNIINVYDFDRDKDTVFMTMELLTGQGLDQSLKDRKYKGFPVAQALDYVSQMSAALIHAHNKGVLHCDFKPNNIFLAKNDVIKVLDFGIAQANRKNVEEPAEHTKFDAKNLGALTAGYASREIHEGLDPEPTDDVFALACVAYQLLTGKHPYQNKAANTVLEGSEKLPVPVGLNRKQWKALQKGLAIQRKDRTQTVNEFIEGINPSGHVAVNYKLVAAVVVVFLMIGLAFYIPSFLNQNQINNLVTEFLSEDFARVEAAFEELESFQEDEKQILLNLIQSDMISLFDDTANLITDSEDAKRFLPYIQQARSFWPDSSTLENSESYLVGLEDIETFNFDANFNLALQSNLITSDSGPGNIEDLLNDIEQSNPQSPLLSDPRLRISIQQQAQRAAQNGDFDTARTLLSFGLQRFSGNVALIDIRDSVDLLESNNNAVVVSQPLDNVTTGLSQDRERLDELIENPLLTPAWDIELIRLRNLLLESRSLTSAEFEAVNELAGEKYMEQVSLTIDQGRFNEASRLIISGRNYAPDLDWDAQEALVTDAFEESIRVAEIEGQKYTFQTQITAMRLDLAQESLNKLIELELSPDDPFLINAFVELAGRANNLGNLQDALGYVAAGLDYVSGSPELLNLQDEIRLAINRQQIRTYFVDQAGNEETVRQLLAEARELAPQEHAGFITAMSTDISETLTKLDRAAAVTWLTSVKGLLPELGDSLDQFVEPDSNQRIETLVGTSQNYLDEGTIDPAVENYLLALEIDPNNLQVKELLDEISVAIYAKADELFEDAQYAEAINIADSGIALEPTNIRPLERLKEDSQSKLTAPRRRPRAIGF